MKVSAFEPPRRMVWTGGDMPEAMFKGERIFTVAPSGDGGARFRMETVFSGLMAPLILGSVGDLQPRVDEFATVLKRRAEKGGNVPSLASRSAADPDGEAPSVTIVRRFDAPVEEAFTAWTDPELLRQRPAPVPCAVEEARADARPGGRYRIVVVDPVGNRHVTTGEFREVVRDQRLVQTWVYEGPNAPEPYPTLLTVDFRKLGPESTEITLFQEQLLAEADREGNREGWRLCFEKLDDVLQAQA